MPAELELGLEQLLPGGGPKLFETGDLDMRERLVREVGERCAAPQPKGFAQKASALLGFPAFCGLGHESLEAIEVDPVGVDVEHVSGCARAYGVSSQCLAQLGHEVLEGADRRLWGFAGPELVDEPVGRYDLSGTEHQQSQEGALLSPVQLERAPLHEYLERPEDAELDLLHEPRFTTVKGPCLASLSLEVSAA